MSRRSSLFFVPFVLFAVVGVALAFTSIFPEKSGFPTMPTGTGTLGDILTHYFDESDGTARNTDQLNGRTATGYVGINGSTCPATEVWKGISSTGTVICGPRGALLTIGRFSEIAGNIQVQKGGAGSWTPANTTDILMEGDHIRTDATGTGTIDFLADASIVRLSTNTNLTLSRGTLAGNTVPQIEVTSGKTWGRVLTSTGVNIGGGGLVAGVRGTSVDVEKNGSTYTLAVVDSQRTSDIATVNCGIHLLGQVNTPARYAYTGGSCTSATSTPTDKKSLAESNEWVRKNLALDITYLTSITNTAELTATQQCGAGYMFWKRIVNDGRPIINSTPCISNSIYAVADMRYGSLSGNITSNDFGDTYDSKNDYPGRLYLQDNTGYPIGITLYNTTYIDATGIKIIGSGAIEYRDAGFIGNDIGGFAGKTITIQYSGTPIAGGVIGYFGESNVKWGGSDLGWIFTGVNNTGSTTNSITFTFPATSIVSALKIGNNSSNNRPIGVTIESIKITQ